MYVDRHSCVVMPHPLFYLVYLKCPYAYDLIPSSNKYRLSSKHDNDVLFNLITAKLMFFTSDCFHFVMQLFIIE